MFSSWNLLKSWAAPYLPSLKIMVLWQILSFTGCISVLWADWPSVHCFWAAVGGWSKQQTTMKAFQQWLVSERVRGGTDVHFGYFECAFCSCVCTETKVLLLLWRMANMAMITGKAVQAVSVSPFLQCLNVLAIKWIKILFRFTACGMQHLDSLSEEECSYFFFNRILKAWHHEVDAWIILFFCCFIRKE